MVMLVWHNCRTYGEVVSESQLHGVVGNKKVAVTASASVQAAGLAGSQSSGLAALIVFNGDNESMRLVAKRLSTLAQQLSYAARQRCLV